MIPVPGEEYQGWILIALALIVVFAFGVLMDERRIVKKSDQYPHPKDGEGRYGHIHFHSHGKEE